ncbi:MAG: transcriptional regulator [Rhodoglobus sp.]|nr:transcriptional regulator [Rhodoglobus sp.]
MSTKPETAAYIEDQLAGLPVRTGRMFGEYAQAYPGSKDYHTVPGDLLENRDWLHAAIESTADALPEPAPKKRKAPKQ